MVSLKVFMTARLPHALKLAREDTSGGLQPLTQTATKPPLLHENPDP